MNFICQMVGLHLMVNNKKRISRSWTKIYIKFNSTVAIGVSYNIRMHSAQTNLYTRQSYSLPANGIARCGYLFGNKEKRLYIGNCYSFKCFSLKESILEYIKFTFSFLNNVISIKGCALLHRAGEVSISTKALSLELLTFPLCSSKCKLVTNLFSELIPTFGGSI